MNGTLESRRGQEPAATVRAPAPLSAGRLDAEPAPQRATARATGLSHGSGANTLLRVLRLAIWSVLHFFFYFVQQLAELLAPLLLAAGVGWWLLPHVVSAITTQAGAADSQARDILNSISGTIPSGLHLAGFWITPGGLIFDGLLLMALAAVGATLSAVAAREM